MFTDRSVQSLRAKASRYEVWEGGGFGMRVSPRNVKSWVFVYRFQGRPRRLTLGTYPAMGLADARIALANARKDLTRKIDPGDERVAENKAEREAETVTELVEDYLERWARPHKRASAADEDERVLKKDIVPIWGKRKARDIARADILALLDRIMARGAPIQANNTLKIVRRMYNWAIEKSLVEMNPCHAVKRPAKPVARERVLATGEIETLWKGLGNPELAMSATMRSALKFQLVTAQRKGEVIAAEWSEIDEAAEVWTIPGSKAKNGRAHRVPLSPLAIELLSDIMANAEKHLDKDDPKAKLKWLFPSPRGDRPVTGPAVDHAMRNNRDILGTGDATPHDLRRTAASQMGSLRIPRLVIAKVLNHVDRSVTAIYDRHSYDDEKRQALDAWAEKLSHIVSGKVAASAKVVRLRAGK